MNDELSLIGNESGVVHGLSLRRRIIHHSQIIIRKSSFE